MKQTIKILLLLLPGVVGAQGVTTLVDGKAATIRSAVPAGGTGDITYQWYRNDAPIANATDTGYTVPANEAYGMNVEFKRKAMIGGEECSGVDEGWSNPVVVSFLPGPTAVITGSTTVCASATGLMYSVTNVPGTTYTWTVPQNWQITAGQGTASITVTSSTVGGTVSVTPSCSEHDAYSGTARTLAVEVHGVPTTPSSIVAAPSAVCAGQSGITYSVANVPSTTYTWVVPTANGWVITYGQGSSSIIATAGTLGGMVGVTPSVCGNSGPSQTLNVTLGSAPVMPSTIAGSTTVCPGEIDVVYSVTNLSGITYTWAVPNDWSITEGQGSNSVKVMAGSAGGTVSVTPSTACGGSGPARELSVSIRTMPSQPSSITPSHTTICAGQTVTYSVASVQGVYYTWSVPANWAITDGHGSSSITVTASTGGGEVSAMPSVCGSIVGTASTLPVRVGAAPAQPSAIAGNTTVCSGETNVYSVASVSGVTYTWAFPQGWTPLSGQGSSSITVTVGSAAGVVSVTPSNCGGNGVARTLTTAMGTGTAPAQPSAITANPSSICPNQTGVTLSVANVAGVSYAWSVPQGWTITAGQGSSSITVRVGASGGNVSVTPSVCGGTGATRTQAIAVNGTAPATPSAIAVSHTAICSNQTGVAFSVASVPSVSYAWAVPAGWQITSGQNSRSITVTAGTGGGTVSVTPSTAGCSSAGTPQTLAVTLDNAPAQPDAITASPAANAITVDQEGLTYTVTSVPGVSYSWAVPLGWTITAGQGTNSITATAGGSAGTNSVSVTPRACSSNGTVQSLSVTVNATPPQPSAITANPATICAGQAGITYSVDNVPGTTYTWTVPQDWSITSGQGFNMVTVTAGTSNGNVSVTPSVGSVTGVAPSTLAVSLTTTLAQPSAIAGVTATCSGSADITYSVDNVSGVTYTWVVPAGWAIAAGQGTSSITIATFTSGGEVRVTPSLAACSIAGAPQTLTVAVSTICGSPCSSSLGTSIAGLCWANRNVAASGAFAARPDAYTQFFQWNRTTAWAAIGTVSSWNSTADQSASWTNNGQPPCPSGWRLPTQAEFNALHNSSTPAGGSWVNANERGVAVAGRFFGPSHATCTSSSMGGCVFLPALGIRGSSGTLSNQGSNGYYWSATQYDSGTGYSLNFYSTGSRPSVSYNKTYGFGLRCVQ